MRALFPLRALDSIAERGSAEVASFVEDVLQTLNDLIEYFKQPDSELEHEQKQCLLRSLIKRQDLFKEEVRAELELFWPPVHFCFFFLCPSEFKLVPLNCFQSYSIIVNFISELMWVFIFTT